MRLTEHLLVILAEECVEVAQRADKALRFSLTEIQPGQPFTNSERIAHEFYHVLAMIEMLEECGALKRTGDTHAIERKKAAVNHYLELSRANGTLQN